MRQNLLRAIVPVFLISIVLLSSAGLAQSDTQLDPSGHVRFRVLYNFTGAEDGAFLYGGLARDQRGSLYGVTFVNGGAKGGGALFKLARERTGYKLNVLHDLVYDPAGDCMTTPVFDHEGNLFGVCRDGAEGGEGGTLWEYSRQGKFSILHVFNGVPDGMEPEDAVAVDDGGNIYGTTYTDGTGYGGTLWKYSRPAHTFTVLHSFDYGTDDGELLPAGPTLDGNGKLWGTTEFGPDCYYCGAGTVWSYDLASGTFTTVLDFGSSDVFAPTSRLALDSDGNLYGTASSASGCGAVYELEKNNQYAPVILYSFLGNSGDGCSPLGNVALDKHGNLLGTTYFGGNSGRGIVYMLSRNEDKWKETILHSFNYNDGSGPNSGLVEGEGRWFGTATFGGTLGEGVIFELAGAK